MWIDYSSLRDYSTNMERFPILSRALARNTACRSHISPDRSMRTVLRDPMGNNAQPVMVSRSRRRDACGGRVSSPRFWTERQELRGDDLAALARAYPGAQPLSESWRRFDDPPPTDELLFEEESRDPEVADWERELEWREERFHDFLRFHFEEVLNPIAAEDLTPEKVDEVIALAKRLLPHLSKERAQWVEARLLEFTTWDGLGLYAHRLELHRKWKEELALPQPELTPRLPRRGRGRYSNRR